MSSVTVVGNSILLGTRPKFARQIIWNKEESYTNEDLTYLPAVTTANTNTIMSSR